MYIYEIFLFVGSVLCCCDVAVSTLLILFCDLVLLVMATRASVIVTTNNTLQGTYLSAQIFYQGMQRIQTQA